MFHYRKTTAMAARQSKQTVPSPLGLLPFQDNVVLNQGCLALAHPTNLSEPPVPYGERM